jgi:radical SAM superfamily enzyme YgiQ (UPF0313 family)
MKGGFAGAVANLRRHRIRLYATFIFGYDSDAPESFAETVDFAREQGCYIAAFNHLTPFPGTPLYRRLHDEGRLLYDAWWLDEGYSYNMIPFRPAGMTPEALQRGCIEARRSFYSWRSIFRRSVMAPNRFDSFMFRNFFLINAMHRQEVSERDHYPLGDPQWTGPLLKAS